MQIMNKRGKVADMALNLIYTIVGGVIALTAFALLLPYFVNATNDVAGTGVTGSALFSTLLPFILVIFVFIAFLVLVTKMAKGSR